MTFHRVDLPSCRVDLCGVPLMQLLSLACSWQSSHSAPHSFISLNPVSHSLPSSFCFPDLFVLSSFEPSSVKLPRSSQLSQRFASYLRIPELFVYSAMDHFVEFYAACDPLLIPQAVQEIVSHTRQQFGPVKIINHFAPMISQLTAA